MKELKTDNQATDRTLKGPKGTLFNQGNELDLILYLRSS